MSLLPILFLSVLIMMGHTSTTESPSDPTPAVVSNATLTWGATNNTKLSYFYRTKVADKVSHIACRNLCLLNTNCSAYWHKKDDNSDIGTCYITNSPLHKARVAQNGEKVYCKLRSGISWTKIEVKGIQVRYRYAYKRGQTDLPQCLQLCELDYSCSLVHYEVLGQCTTAHHWPALDTLRVGRGSVNLVMVGTISKVVAVGIGAVVLTPASLVASTVFIAFMQSIGEAALEKVLPGSESIPAGVYLKDVPVLSQEDLEKPQKEIYLVYDNEGRLVGFEEDTLDSTEEEKQHHINDGHQESCTLSGPPCGMSVHQNQRWWFTGWGKTFLTDPPRYTDTKTGKLDLDITKVSPPNGCEWKSEWTIRKSEDTDKEGWQYSRDFRWFRWHPEAGLGRSVRRRMWIRECQKKVHIVDAKY